MRLLAAILNFDHVYELQPSFQGKSYEWIDVTDLEADLRVIAT